MRDSSIQTTHQWWMHKLYLLWGTRHQVLLPANFHFVLQNLQRITFIKLVANIYLALNQLQEFIATSF